MLNEERYEIGNRISIISIIVNIILSGIKLAAGIFGKSSAMVADSVHTLSDVASTIAVIIGLKISKKPADKEHPYGHEKAEPVMAKILAIMLILTAVGIGYGGVIKIIEGSEQIPENIALYGAILSIIIKEWMYRFTIKGAEKINSPALKADAWHHRSDAMSSVGSLVGIFVARMGYPVFDSITAIVIALFIIKVGVSIYIDSIKQLIDQSVDQKSYEDIKRIILNTTGVIGIDDLKTRVHANKIFVDVEICVDKNLSLIDAHKIAENVHNKIEGSNNDIKHCMVHVNPYDETISYHKGKRPL